MTKICTNCKQELSIERFSKRTDTTGYKSECKLCAKVSKREQARAKAKLKPKTRRRQVWERNKILAGTGRMCSVCLHEKSINVFTKKGSVCTSCRSTHYQKNKDKILAKNKQNYYKNVYGITREELGSNCQICQKDKDLVIDHCHTSGKVRGLLCRQCNSGLGFFKEDAVTINKALEYLNAFQNSK